MQATWQRINWVVALIGVVWIVEILNLLVGRWLNLALGLLPRAWDGLIGIPFMPLLHGSPGHALTNTLPMLILGGLLGLTARRRIWVVNAAIVAIGGVLVWLLGRPLIHVGASGLVFGWFGFLVARGFYDRSFVTAVISLGVGLAYAGMILGVLPRQEGMSWEAHLFGLIAGIATAALIRAPVDDPKRLERPR